MITIEAFIEKLEEEFEDIEKGTLHPDFDYRKIENWGSMHALIIIALVDTEFDISLSGSDLQNTQTINDLYKVIETKMKASD
ncbi:hypothetical protein [Parvicella tangerina]|uniref:Acyl carrier protein n=1 Tax=Parvicella tangerina TaxID=2829795 RepID=A0A916JLG0_9FLAO|nr:hypothetical protein [Parvicella tangerina]CAG5079149.1 hypothetical protein CRYO30217_00872 [Parvicella tangerina]